MRATTTLYLLLVALLSLHSWSNSSPLPVPTSMPMAEGKRVIFFANRTNTEEAGIFSFRHDCRYVDHRGRCRDIIEQMGSKQRQIFMYAAIVLTLVALCAPRQVAGTRVIFHAPRRMQIVTGQILSSRSKEAPCQKCHMRDHRGRCRRILSFNADGIQC